ncbi:hypothetical protein ABT104_00745 [Streptomyces mobaraensis]|uniref:hypothetical protein n=1 Tax=Streptomyces mobaraensis TaxID=35621 RepID=UPI0033342208
MSTYTVPPTTGPDAEPTPDFFVPLRGLVAEDELEALRISPVLRPLQRAALTLVSLGHSHRETAALLGGRPHSLHGALDRADKTLGSGGRTPALLHAAYRTPGYPLPRRRGAAADPRPVLNAEERAVLDAYATGVTLLRLAEARRCTARHLTVVNRRLLTHLAARTPVHGVRRAWELGIYTRHNCPAREYPLQAASSAAGRTRCS